MRYLQAVHETGSRVTHDVKNLLQSLDALCHAATESGQAESESREFAGLVRRQLPQIAQRLRLTLDKLSGQDDRVVALLSCDEWWQGAQDRYQGMQIGFARASSAPAPKIPAAAFDNVLDNLLANAAQKRAATPDLLITVTLESAEDGCRLIVSDNGEPLDDALADSLFRGPVTSRNGLGVGLYHAARMAEQQGYRLILASNQPGDVEFALSPCRIGDQGTRGSTSG
jgi:C4-dicarboxylate-specific signal transduction histidine kinase